MLGKKQKHKISWLIMFFHPEILLQAAKSQDISESHMKQVGILAMKQFLAHEVGWRDRDRTL
jgi:hypothetical protein